ncbi:MAG: Penicillin-insensitive murein endopeptidase, partial [Thermoleophilales bacterium]|nr:Penicillin-insensitive murein endopeptidase [Thermoleophilales bacterium]
MLSFGAVRRALPIAAVLGIAGLLAAAVLAATPPDDRTGAPAANPLALMAHPPTEVVPNLAAYQESDPQAPAADEPRVPRPPIAQPKTPPRRKASQRSRSIGEPWKGRLENAVQFPDSGPGFFTLDMALKTSPSRWWRRCATDTTVTRTMAVLAAFRAAHPDGPRLGVGDLSLPAGGPFGPEYGGGLGHRSHQNGQDVDIYWPRRDRAEREPERPSLVDR